MPRGYPQGMKRLVGFGLASVFAAAAFAGSSDARNAGGLCTGSMLTGSFKAVPGSAGAGNIVYRLTVENASSAECGVTGLPGLQLLGKTGKKLPTNTSFAGFRGALTAVLVPLQPRGTASLTARFSPDVPGIGEQHPGACEATAYKLRVTPSAGGTAIVAISPPTPVCEHGGMQLTVFTAAK
jgi:Protein of unknown function (DUF4232)